MNKKRETHKYPVEDKLRTLILDTQHPNHDLFLKGYKRFANRESFIENPARAAVYGYHPTKMDILSFVTSMPKVSALKNMWFSAWGQLDGLDTSINDILQCLLHLVALLVLLLTPVLWPIGFFAARELFKEERLLNAMGSTMPYRHRMLRDLDLHEDEDW